MSQKREPRHTVNHAFASVDSFVSDYLSNLSRTGVFIRSDDPLPIGTRINLRFTVRVDGEIKSIEGLGEVVRLESGAGQQPAGMGVAFLDLTAVSKEIIERILARK